MVVDIVSQQQLTEVFTTSHTHHRSLSSTHRRNSSTVNSTSSSTSTTHTAMTNGHRFSSHELGKKAEQILGQPTTVLDYRRQSSMDLQGQHPFRLNITEPKPNLPSRNNAATIALASVHIPSTSTSTLSAKTVSSDNSNGKNKRLVTVEQLVPLIFQLVARPKFLKLPSMISRHRSNSKPIKTILNSRDITLALHRESVVQLSDDENEDEEEEEDDDDDDDDDDDNDTNTNEQNNNQDSVLIELVDKKSENNSTNQNNSNDNPPHQYENQAEIQHSGLSSSRCQEDDSEDDDSDNQETAHSDAENDDQIDSTNPSTLSLMYFISRQEPLIEPADSSLKHSPESLPAIKKRSISPDTEHDHDNHADNSEDHQNKRKKLLIKRALLKSFVSSVNTKIDIKRPSLPITIPTHLLFDQSLSDSIKSSDEPMIELSQRTSKRNASGTQKCETNTDAINGISHSTMSTPLNNSTSTTSGTHQKKNKTSHVHEKNIPKSEPSIVVSTIIKNESTFITNVTPSNETDNRARTAILLATTHTAAVTPVTTTQPKKEKPTANVRPLQQSTAIDNLSSSNSFNTNVNTSDNLAASTTRSMLPSTKMNLTKLKNMSKTDLAALARKKKKQADSGKRTTFDEAREAMSLYLESVCYFIQCANDESKLDQRTALLSTTLNMLQQLVCNHQKLFHVSNHSADLLFNIRQKFLLINYWLQSIIHHLQFNASMPNIERSANQVTDYFHQLKNPSSAAAMTKTTTTMNTQQQLTPINDSNPISPLSVTSQTSASDSSTTSVTQPQEPHRCVYDFSKLMLNSYYSTYYWNKAERLMRDKSLKEFTEQLWKQNQNRRLSRDDTTLDFLLYMFDAIELLRLSVA